MFDEAAASAHPDRCVPPNLPARPAGRCVVVGAGKGAAVMAASLEAAWDVTDKRQEVTGVVVAPYGAAKRTKAIDVRKARHPLPDAASERAAREIVSCLSDLTAHDLVVVLLSGGGSALMALPLEPITLADKQQLSDHLLSSGATISEINCVRKHLSAVKGGRLAEAAWPAQMVTLAISDVPGDAPDIIASGPTVPDPTTQADALDIIAKYQAEVPERVAQVLTTDAYETPKPGDEIFSKATYRLIARPQDALEAAAAVARDAHIEPLLLGDALEGEAHVVARAHAALAIEHRRRQAPCVLLSGGELTVARAAGAIPRTGGPNREYALALALELGGHPDIYALAADTDGVDGACRPGTPVAGAFVTPTTLARAEELELNARRHLTEHRSGDFFDALGDHLISGATDTNVNDFRAILIVPPDA